jgi:hypothetical protein
MKVGSIFAAVEWKGQDRVGPIGVMVFDLGGKYGGSVGASSTFLQEAQCTLMRKSAIRTLTEIWE